MNYFDLKFYSSSIQVENEQIMIQTESVFYFEKNALLNDHIFENNIKM